MPVVGCPPVAWYTNNNNASLNAYPQLPFPDDPNANVTHRPGAASGSRSVAGSGYGGSSSQQQNHTPDSNQYSYSQYSGGGMGGGGGTGGGHGGSGGGGGGRGGGNRSDGDRNWRPRGYRDATKPKYSSTDAHTTTTEDEKGTHGSGSGDSDDMPLARRLPGALTAQKSLRRQVREDRDTQRQVRARARAKSAPRSPIPPPTKSADGGGSGNLSADELTKKLLRVQVQSSPSPLPLPSPLNREPTALVGSPGHYEQHSHTSASTYNKYAFTASAPRSHWPEAYPINRKGSESSDRHYPHASPVVRPTNTSQPNTAGDVLAFPQFPPSPHPQHQPPYNLQRAMTSATSQPRPRSGRPSHEMPEPRQRTETLVPKSVRQRANTLSSPASSRPTTSSTSASSAVIPPLPVPTLPGRGFAHAGDGGSTMQQRVFVGDMQRVSTVEIGPATKARDVIAMVDEMGELPREAKAGGWMLFELNNDFGMGE